MSAWEGFTDEDLKRIKGDESRGDEHASHSKDAKRTAGRKKQTTPSGGKTRPPRRAARPNNDGLDDGCFFNQPGTINSVDSARVDPLSRASKTSGLSTYGTCVVDVNGEAADLDTAPSPRQSTSRCASRSGHNVARRSRSPTDGIRGLGGKDPERGQLPEHNDDDDDTSMRVCTNEDLQSLQKSRLEILDEQQKQLKELNQQRRAQLHETLRERYQQTQKETVRLQTVQKELAHLDSILTDDVTILRGKIEDAALSLSAAQKRYSTAEAEFVSSKLWLHRCQEQKELLTEHLFTIIQQNEVRKAQKLASLMGQLEMEGGNEADFPTLPPLPLLHNDVEFHPPPKADKNTPGKQPEIQPSSLEKNSGTPEENSSTGNAPSNSETERKETMTTTKELPSSLAQNTETKQQNGRLPEESREGSVLVKPEEVAPSIAKESTQPSGAIEEHSSISTTLQTN